jgi:hypothetical protein
LNRGLLLAIFCIVVLYEVLSFLGAFSLLMSIVEHSRQLLVIFLVLLPVSMTMTLLWKTKEVILAGVFGPDR